MKKIIASCIMFLMSLSVANAKTIDYLVTGTPGGTSYDNAEMFIPILEKETGYTIKKVIVDSCVGGTIYLKSSKNPSIFITSTLNHEDKGCDMQATEKSFIGTGWGRAMAFCSMDDMATAVYKYNDIQTFTYLDSANMNFLDVRKFRKAWINVMKSDTITAHIKNKKLFHPDLYGENPNWVEIVDKAGKNWVGK